MKRTNPLQRCVVISWAAGITLGGLGCATTTKLADTSGGHAGLPAGFHPLVGLDADDPNHYVDGYPRYIVGDHDNMVMTYVRGGEYLMGEGAARRKVYVDPFYIDVHEVTNSQFDRFRKAGGKKHWKRQNWDRPELESNAFHRYEYENWPRLGDKQKMYPETAMNFWFWKGQAPQDLDSYLDYWVPGTNNDHPARAVSWWEALLYTMWAGKRLPTEAQWELAARGPHNDRVYPWGNDLGSAPCRVNSGQAGIDDRYDHAAPVMALAGGISPFGCYNMSGNVWEWCQDNWDPCLPLRPQGRPFVDPNPVTPAEGPHGVVDLAAAVEVNPVGPLHNDEKVLRGGSYTNDLGQCKVTTRSGARANVHQMNIGFRCVLPVPPSTEDRMPVEVGSMEGCCLEHPYRYHQRP